MWVCGPEEVSPAQSLCLCGCAAVVPGPERGGGAPREGSGAAEGGPGLGEAGGALHPQGAGGDGGTLREDAQRPPSPAAHQLLVRLLIGSLAFRCSGPFRRPVCVCVCVNSVYDSIYL